MVKNESVYGRMNDDDPPDEKDCIEKYDDIEATKGSKYRKVFVGLDKVLKMIED